MGKQENEWKECDVTKVEYKLIQRNLSVLSQGGIGEGVIFLSAKPGRYGAQTRNSKKAERQFKLCEINFISINP